MAASALETRGEGGGEDHLRPPGAQRAHLRPPVVAGPGPGQHRVDRPPVWVGRGGGPPGLGPLRGGGDRCRPGPVGALSRAPLGLQGAGGRVCLGEVGAIFGLEVSRLARSSADLSRLLELARLTELLVVDADGIYDLANFNDRLLLGLKGTMSEAELHLLAGRLQGAKRAAAERGELRFPLPVGYVYDDEGATVMDPDAEVAAAVTDLFAAFRAGGSAYQVVAAFKERRFPLRAYGGVWAGQLRWGRLTHSRVLGILANPAYAGTYVFGRYHSRRVVAPDGTVRTKLVELARQEWPVVIHDHHPGYISWDDYLADQARLQANTTNAGARPPREGHALCQGIIVCGSCGRPMSTRYHRNGHAAYECSASRADQTATATCRSISAVSVDDAVAERLLDALNPEEVALALAAADEVADRRARRSRAAELAVERARYQADRAERAFHACEPENRLVARSLESRWESRLAALAEAEKALTQAQAAVPSLPSRTELQALTANVSGLWHAPTTAARDRKRLLRTLVADVTLLPEPDLAKARIGFAGTPAPPTRWSSPAARASSNTAEPIPPPSSSPDGWGPPAPTPSSPPGSTRSATAQVPGGPSTTPPSPTSARPTASRPPACYATARSRWPRRLGAWWSAPTPSMSGSRAASSPPGAASTTGCACRSAQTPSGPAESGWPAQPRSLGT